MTGNLSQDEAAELLGVSQKTVSRWLRQGVIPNHRSSGKTVFRRDELLQWARERRLGCVGPTAKERLLPASSRLAKALRIGGLIVDLAGTDVAQVLDQAVARVPVDEQVDRTRLLELLMHRESIVSTGIGGGVALPHPHHPAELGFAASRVTCCYLKQAIEFGSLDGCPVGCLFVVLAVDTESHLQLMSQLAHALRKPVFRQKIENRSSLEDLLACL